MSSESPRVELPLVSSSRSSSSSRGSLGSAGSASTASIASTGSKQSKHVIADGSDGIAEELHDEVKSALWDEVEVFLNKPPPSLGSITKADNHPHTTVLPLLKPNSVSDMPQLRRKSSKGIMDPSLKSDEQHKPSLHRTSKPPNQSSHTANSRPIDAQLLQQAFEYASRIQSTALAEGSDSEEEGQTQSSKKTTAATSRSDGDGKKPKSSSNQQQEKLHHASQSLKKKNSVRAAYGGRVHNPTSSSSSSGASASASVYSQRVKPSSTKQTAPRQQEWNDRTVIEPKSGDEMSSRVDTNSGNSGNVAATCDSMARKNTMDPLTFQSLVSNFENGITLQELRKELAASQQSLAYSSACLQEAARSFFAGKY